MRQVPVYLIIGNGAVARHMKYYFSLLQIPYESWGRHQPKETLLFLLPKISHILLLIKDDAIESFIEENLLSANNFLMIHFCGGLITKHAIGAHPLTTFGVDLYTLAEYKNIPFVLDTQEYSFSDLFPNLSNPNYYLPPQHKIKYHALAVASGNFSCLMWQKFFATLKSEFNLPEEVAYPYLKKVTQNLLQENEKALTGPLARGDQKTILKHLNALDTDDFKGVYLSFLEYYRTLKGKTV